MSPPLHVQKHHARLYRAWAARDRLESCPRNYAAEILNHAGELRRLGRYRHARASVLKCRASRLSVWIGLGRLP